MIDWICLAAIVIVLILLFYIHKQTGNKSKGPQNVLSEFPAKICVFNTAPFDGLWGVPGKHNRANYICLDIYRARIAKCDDLTNIAAALTTENTQLYDKVSQLNTACAKLETEVMSVGCEKGGFELRITNVENNIEQALIEAAGNDTTSARSNAQLYIDGIEDAYINVVKWLKTEAKEFNRG